MTTTTTGLPARHVAMLRAVAAGRAELTCSCMPDLYVDGRPCTDHGASAALAAAGLVARAAVGRLGARVPARLTAAGVVVLAGLDELTRRAEPGAADSEDDVPTRRCDAVPSRRRVGSANCSDEDVMVATTNRRDCLAVGCDWDWWQERCRHGHGHTVRVCRRCRTPDEPEPCLADEEPAEPAGLVAGVAA